MLRDWRYVEFLVKRDRDEPRRLLFLTEAQQVFQTIVSIAIPGRVERIFEKRLQRLRHLTEDLCIDAIGVGKVRGVEYDNRVRMLPARVILQDRSAWSGMRARLNDVPFCMLISYEQHQISASRTHKAWSRGGFALLSTFGSSAPGSPLPSPADISGPACLKTPAATTDCPDSSHLSTSTTYASLASTVQNSLSSHRSRSFSLHVEEDQCRRVACDSACRP